MRVSIDERRCPPTFLPPSFAFLVFLRSAPSLLPALYLPFLPLGAPCSSLSFPSLPCSLPFPALLPSLPFLAPFPSLPCSLPCRSIRRCLSVRTCQVIERQRGMRPLQCLGRRLRVTLSERKPKPPTVTHSHSLTVTLTSTHSLPAIERATRSFAVAAHSLTHPLTHSLTHPLTHSSFAPFLGSHSHPPTLCVRGRPTCSMI